jgi:hypothetical protein
MTAFEYFSVMVSVILALGIAQILGGVGRIIQYRGASVYWVHGVWTVVLLASHFRLWWTLWDLRAGFELSYYGFLALLMGPTLLFLAARVLMPDFSDPGEANLEDYFFRIRRAFFTLLLLFGLGGAFVGTVLTGQPPAAGRLVLQALVIAPLLACLLSDDRRLHAAVAVWFAAGFVALTLIEVW